MNNKIKSLVDWFTDKGHVMVAVSGGVDSALVAYAAFCKLGDKAVAVTADYKTLSVEELKSAEQICDEIGIKQIIIQYSELENAKFTKNDNTRCFHCRTELGTRLVALAKEYNFETIVDGTNLDDLGEYRPGIDAMKSNGIQSPLLDIKFTKMDVRAVALEVGLSIHDRPSNSCLASRIPWGQRITTERLTRIEIGEIIVKQVTGAKQVRVRDIKGTARIEVEQEALHMLTDVNDANITTDIKKGNITNRDNMLEQLTEKTNKYRLCRSNNRYRRIQARKSKCDYILIYLDNAASTQIHPKVIDAMMPYITEQYGNPSSIHRHGRLARKAITKARQQVAALINAEPSEILFTSGGTESNNTALGGGGYITTSIDTTMTHYYPIL